MSIDEKAEIFRKAISEHEVKLTKLIPELEQKIKTEI